MDRVEMFGNIAHGLVERVEKALGFITTNHEEPVHSLAIHAGTALEYFERLILKIDIPNSFISEALRNLTEIGMCGHQLTKGGEFNANGLANEMTDLYARKNRDYGNSFDKSMDKHGLVVSVIRMGDKVNRLQSLVAKKGEAEVKDESIADTFMDLACYAIMTLMWFADKVTEVDDSKQKVE